MLTSHPRHTQQHHRHHHHHHQYRAHQLYKAAHGSCHTSCGCTCTGTAALHCWLHAGGVCSWVLCLLYHSLVCFSLVSMPLSCMPFSGMPVRAVAQCHITSYTSASRTDLFSCSASSVSLSLALLHLPLSPALASLAQMHRLSCSLFLQQRYIDKQTYMQMADKRQKGRDKTQVDTLKKREMLTERC